MPDIFMSFDMVRHVLFRKIHADDGDCDDVCAGLSYIIHSECKCAHRRRWKIMKKVM